MGDKGHGGEEEAEAPPCSLLPLHPVTQIWGLDQPTLTCPRDRLSESHGSGLSNILPTFHLRFNLRAEPRGASCLSSCPIGWVLGTKKRGLEL